MLKTMGSRRMAAQLTTTSSRPNSLMASPTRPAAAAWSVMSAGVATARPPKPLISSTTWAAGPSSPPVPSSSTPRSVTTAGAPWGARRFAIPAPMPRPAPVTIATLPSTRPICHLLVARAGGTRSNPFESTEDQVDVRLFEQRGVGRTAVRMPLRDGRVDRRQGHSRQGPRLRLWYCELGARVDGEELHGLVVPRAPLAPQFSVPRAGGAEASEQRAALSRRLECRTHEDSIHLFERVHRTHHRSQLVIENSGLAPIELHQHLSAVREVFVHKRPAHAGAVRDRLDRHRFDVTADDQPLPHV